MAEKTQACIFPRGWGFALIISNYSSHIQIRTECQPNTRHPGTYWGPRQRKRKADPQPSVSLTNIRGSNTKH